MKPTALPDELLSLAADKFRMLGDETRLAILQCLMELGEASVSEIVGHTDQQVANISKHLKLLAEKRLLVRRQQGSFVYYKLDDPLLVKICTLVCDSLRRDLKAEVKKKTQMLHSQR